MSQHPFSAGAQRALERARAEAVRLGHESIAAEHVVLGLLVDEDIVGGLVRRLGADPEELRERLVASAARGRSRGAASGDELAYTSYAKRLIDVAAREARQAGTDVTAEHLLLATALESRSSAAKILSDAGITPERIQPQRIQPQRIQPRDARARKSARSVDRPAPGDHRPMPGPERGAPARAPSSPMDAAGAPAPRWRYVLLLAVPISVILAWLLHPPPIWVFITACLGVLPLASYMGEATEHLGARTGPTVGGLLNATFGNAAELIIAIVALRAGLVDLVKASITGSILGNLLLILGLALIAGGTGRAQLRFNRTGAGMSAGMLALAVVAMVFPALFHATHEGQGVAAAELHMSEAVSAILLATYGCSLLFTLKTHRRLFGGEPHPVEGPAWGVGKAILILGAATVGVAIESEILVHAVEASTETLGLSALFVGLIVIPIIGNAAEHAAAVVLARKGQIDLSLQIALGSSTQVALLVAPLLVFIGLLFGHNMNLVFRPFEVMALALTTIVTAIITLDGESHWFEGVQLLAVYGMIAVGAFFLR